MKKIILIFIACYSFSSCNQEAKEYREKQMETYEFPDSIRVLTLDGDTVIIENRVRRYGAVGVYQIKTKKHK